MDHNINTPFARIFETIHGTIDEPVIRLYRHSPDGATLQIRVNGPINENHRGVSRKMLATTPLGVNQLRELRTSIDRVLTEIEPASSK